ncbi:2-amino-4-hydroxy-6-hydroxymethyldihydropteridine diphosphokinase [Shouchella shacheensis]|uniref:2-amino-4-hydroxy-6- hydroxymethyldihydropteridine diphosphokinase n=1 Tax=Shouchella shacheensis TaxID=1649580 RepID=UPI00073FE29F|nr:2-amino-4-hydroxy-6-hydroxymethyldihydropteridine diphosphokinase [Shouchella shacheensis]
MKHEAHIALGSNLGNREGYLHEAVGFLDEHHHIHVLRASSIYETEPVGFVDQQSFLNMVVRIETDLEPFELLRATQAIENKLGRIRAFRNGPRTLDLDILLFDQENMEWSSLCIPHPRMWERAFVLVPLAEISPLLYNDAIKQTVKEFCENHLDKEGVKRWKRWTGVGEYARSES